MALFEHLDDTRPLPASSIDEITAIIEAGSRRRRRRQVVAVTVPLVAAVAAVVLVAVASPFSRQSLPLPITSPSPTPTPTPTPTPSPTSLQDDPAGPYEGLFVRGTSLVAVDGQGREHPVRDLAPLGLRATDLRYAAFTYFGELRLRIGDPAVGTTLRSVDLLHHSSNAYQSSGGLGPPDDSPDVWYRHGRDFAGVRLQLTASRCAISVIPCQPGYVRMSDPNGTTTTYYDGDLPGRLLVDASLTRDGRGALLLVTTGDTNSLAVVRADATRRPVVLATVKVVTTDLAGLMPSPDDATALVTAISNKDATRPTTNFYVVPLDGSPPVAAQGQFVGWVPTDVVDAIAAAR